MHFGLCVSRWLHYHCGSVTGTPRKRPSTQCCYGSHHCYSRAGAFRQYEVAADTVGAIASYRAHLLEKATESKTQEKTKAALSDGPDQ